MTNFATLKNYGDISYKVTCHKHGISKPSENRIYTEKGTAGNDEKLKNNLSRARSMVYELAVCNEWEYFMTLTLDGSKRDRSDLKGFCKDFSQMIRDMRKLSNPVTVDYLVIPEKHEDGNWHQHGLAKGIPENELVPLKGKLPKRLRNMIKAGRKLYTWPRYADRFGFCVIERIQNLEASAKYLVKYITEDLGRSVTALGAHMYYATQGLRRAEREVAGELVRGLSYNMFRPEESYFENEYVITKEYKDHEAALSHFFMEAKPNYATVTIPD